MIPTKNLNKWQKLRTIKSFTITLSVIFYLFEYSLLTDSAWIVVKICRLISFKHKLTMC